MDPVKLPWNLNLVTLRMAHTTVGTLNEQNKAKFTCFVSKRLFCGRTILKFFDRKFEKKNVQNEKL